MKHILICLSLLGTVALHGQSKLLDSYVQKNILFYTLTREYKAMQCFDKDDYGIHNSIIYCDWDRLIPDKCSELLLTSRPVDLSYPIDSISLICYEKKNYQLYDSATNTITDIGGLITRQFDDLYLVGYNRNKPDQIKFISGNIFKDDIWADFVKDGFTKSNVLSYLKLKCFNLRISALEYSKSIGSKMIFTARLEDFKNTFRITFNKNNPRRILVRYKKFKYVL